MSKKKVVSDRELDTTGLHLQIINYNQSVRLRESVVSIAMSGDSDILVVKKDDNEYKVRLGTRLMGDRFVCWADLDEDGEKELLLLEKYYIILGYNFDLKLYKFK